jgi:hypothetical protein
MGTCFDLVALNWLFNRSSRNREVVLEKDTMQILKLRPGECQRDSVTSGDTVYINVDCIVRVIPGSWDEWGGQIVLADGSVYTLRKDVFDRLTQAIQAKEPNTRLPFDAK